MPIHWANRQSFKLHLWRAISSHPGSVAGAKIHEALSRGVSWELQEMVEDASTPFTVLVRVHGFHHVSSIFFIYTGFCNMFWQTIWLARNSHLWCHYCILHYSLGSFKRVTWCRLLPGVNVLIVKHTHQKPSRLRWLDIHFLDCHCFCKHAPGMVGETCTDIGWTMARSLGKCRYVVWA